jgi:hypothetical protein
MDEQQAIELLAADLLAHDVSALAPFPSAAECGSRAQSRSAALVLDHRHARGLRVRSSDVADVTPPTADAAEQRQSQDGEIAQPEEARNSQVAIAGR